MNIFDVKNVEDISKVVVDTLNKTRTKNKITRKEYNHYYYLTKTKIKRQKEQQ